MNHTSNSQKDKWHSLRNAISLLGSLYSVVLLVGLLASIFVQILPLFENLIVIEIARLFTVMFASVFVSYIAIRHLENRISNNMKKENCELHEYLNALNRTLVYDLRISSYLTDLVFHSKHEGALEDFDFVIKQIQNKEEKLKEISKTQKYPSLYTLPTEGSVGAIVELSSQWKIPFAKLAHYLCWKLGKEEANRLVPLDKILQCYGKDEVGMWKSICE